MFDELIDFFDGFLRGFVSSGGTTDDLVGCVWMSDQDCQMVHYYWHHCSID